MQRIGIVAKQGEPRAIEAGRQLIAWIAGRGLDVVVQERNAAAFPDVHSAADDRFADACDLVVVLGGDGSLLHAARMVGTSRVPIFPVNLGHLGFLCNSEVDGLIPHMDEILGGSYQTVERLLLAGEIERDGRCIDGPFWALNDMVLHLGSIARVLRLKIAIDGFEALPSLAADGLIVSSPTGSTAYNLSAGGPILTPTLQAMILAPMLPLALTQRPLVIDGDSRVEIELLPDMDRAFVTLDGQVKKPFQLGDKLLVHKAPEPVILVDAGQRTFYQILRAKMGWAVKPGEDRA